MFYCYLLEACSVLMRKIEREKPNGREDGEKLGGVEEREDIIRIYCMRKKSICDKSGKFKKKYWSFDVFSFSKEVWKINK